MSKVIIVTGASSGIGAETSRLFGRKGYRVVLAARRINQLKTLAKEIAIQGGVAIPVETDVTDLNQIESMVKTTMREFGQIDILLNNAGFGRMNWLEALDPKLDIDLQLRVNLNGLINTSREVVPFMIQNGSGHIINMVSIAGLIAIPTYSIYAASKFAVRGFTQAIRRELSVFGIHVTGIYPGSVETEFSKHTGRDSQDGYRTPKIIRLTAEEVAKTVYQVVNRPRKSVILPKIMIPLVCLNTIAPGIVDWGIREGFTKAQRSGK
jgi:NADP-dependent 3-hydroxy acid dehydrogenase YdfG